VLQCVWLPVVDATLRQNVVQQVIVANSFAVSVVLLFCVVDATHGLNVIQEVDMYTYAYTYMIYAYIYIHIIHV